MPLTSRAKMPPPTTTKMRGESRAWLRCLLLLLLAGESKERGGVFPHGRAGERERRRTRRSERREGEKKPSPPEVSLPIEIKKSVQTGFLLLSLFFLFFSFTPQPSPPRALRTSKPRPASPPAQRGWTAPRGGRSCSARPGSRRRRGRRRRL